MAIDGVINAFYGPEDSLSNIPKCAIVPGGAIVTVKRIIKRESGMGHHNIPYNITFLASASAFELVKVAGYATLLSIGLYHLLK